MSQHDFDIANQTASNARADINSALQALVSNSSGGSEPATKYANQFWYDTTNNILKLRNEANSAWLNVGYIDQTGGFRVLDDTQVVNTSGTQTGLLGDQSQATWESGTGTTESLVSPAKIKAAIEALAPAPSAGVEFIASVDASNNATINFTGFNATKYDSYVFTFANVVPSSDQVNLIFRTSTNGGSTYDSTSGDYEYTSSFTGITTDNIRLAYQVGSATGEDGVSGELKVYGPHLAKQTYFIAETVHATGAAGAFRSDRVYGRRKSAADVDAIQFLFSSGNVESGTITMYGLRNA